MNTAKLALLACPSLLALILLAPARANEIAAKPTDAVASTSAKPREIVFERPTPKSPLSKITTSKSNDDPMLDFTEAESQAAIQRYGCDCSSCISSVLQLQGKLPLL